MQTKAKNIPRTEFIGKIVEIISANNPSQIGMKGKIVNETKNLFTLETENGETKKLVKKQITIIK